MNFLLIFAISQAGFAQSKICSLLYKNAFEMNFLGACDINLAPKTMWETKYITLIENKNLEATIDRANAVTAACAKNAKDPTWAAICAVLINDLMTLGVK